MAHSDMVQSLARGLDLLRLAAESEHGLLLSELAARLQVRPPTAFNLARTLVAKGFLEKTSRPVRYRLGPAVAELAVLQHRRQWFRKAEMVVLEVFEALSDATVVLTEPTSDDLTVALRMAPARPGALERYPGRTMAPYTNATGLCYLAFAPDAECAAYRRRYPFVENAGRLWKRESELEQFLASAREKGLVVVADDAPFRTAAPVYGPGNQLVAVLGASFSHDQSAAAARKEQMRRTVTAAARRLSSSPAPGRNEG
ncbi:MAG: hypothetical protein A3K19_25550 [Lentisphaerae bacterium RIFOXYB12_FULL_65_16]|nr:MAG: hypothetical protein A3K18_32520 [Lentisphaerae bacterium RIFOXYA12_64_32]OGV84857.1 MAG: hypothetical protein A3K19_25550 [Lentisphaerae bacterium RIFOXYB12_FULL_65_16]